MRCSGIILSYNTYEPRDSNQKIFCENYWEQKKYMAVLSHLTQVITFIRRCVSAGGPNGPIQGAQGIPSPLQVLERWAHSALNF